MCAGEYLRERHPSTELLAKGSVPGERRRAGGYQIAHAGEPGEGVLIGAERCAEASDLGETASDQRGPGVVAEDHADRDADGERDRVLHCTRELAAKHVGIRVRAEVARVAGLLQILGRLDRKSV